MEIKELNEWKSTNWLSKIADKLLYQFYEKKLIQPPVSGVLVSVTFKCEPKL